MRLSLKDTRENMNRVEELLSFPMLLVPGVQPTHESGGRIKKSKVDLQDFFKNSPLKMHVQNSSERKKKKIELFQFSYFPYLQNIGKDFHGGLFVSQGEDFHFYAPLGVFCDITVPL